MGKYLYNILLQDTQGDVMKEKIDHQLDKLEKFHQQYIIIPTEYYNYSIPEDSIYIAVTTPPGFSNQ